jgi:hypothetical protein
MFCWPCVTVYQYSETNVMHFLFNWLEIKSLYMFRAILTHLQEVLHRRHLVYFVRVVSVGCTAANWQHTRSTSIPSASVCSRCDTGCCDTVCSYLQVHLRSHFIMNGVCVRWRGWIDLERLDGVGCLEYDEDKAQVLSQLNIYWALFLKHFCSLPLGSAALWTFKVKSVRNWPTVI